MNGFLLDTNVVILSLADPDRLSSRTQKRLMATQRYMSVLTYWEVLLKSMKGKLDVGEPRLWWAEALELLGATVLAFRQEHIGEICSLPPIHTDPFDRALIAQARVEQLTFVTTDVTIRRYPVEILAV